MPGFFIHIFVNGNLTKILMKKMQVLKPYVMWLTDESKIIDRKVRMLLLVRNLTTVR